MTDLFTLDKASDDVQFVLSKKLGVDDIPRDINVSLILDYSISMESLYSNGSIVQLLRRLLGVSNTIDDDGVMKFILFESNVIPQHDLLTNDFDNIDQIVYKISNKHSMGGTVYSPALNYMLSKLSPPKVPNFLLKIGSFFGMKPSESNANLNKQLIIMITDGDNSNSDTVEFNNALQKVHNSSNLFLQFVSLGSFRSHYLQDLAKDSLSIGYSHITDLKSDDAQIIEAVLTQKALNKFEGV